MLFNSTPAEHAPASPSDGGVWVNCPGKLRLQNECEPVPEHPNYSEASEEGEAAHYFASLFLMSLKYPDGTDRTCQPPNLGDKAPNGQILTFEMFHAIFEYFHHVMTSFKMHSMLMIENKQGPSDIFGPNCWGTPDLYAILHDSLVVFLRDYKHGFGLVEVLENWQQIIYAGILSERLNGDNYTYDLGIVQPRGFHPQGTIRLWTTDEKTLNPYWDRVKDALQKAYGSDKFPSLIAGPWCDMCRCRLSCPSHNKVVGKAMDFNDRAVPVNMSADDKATQFILAKRMLKTLQSRVDALELQLISDYETKGIAATHVEYSMGKGRRKWKENVTPEMVKQLGDMENINLAKPLEVITPTQAIQQGLDERAVMQLSEQPNTGVKLKQATAKAKLIFSKGS